MARNPVRTAADYLTRLMGLLPRGRIWPREADSVISQTLSGLAPIYSRNEARSRFLLTDAFPSTAVELLPEWESTLGLPDACAGPEPTLELRQAAATMRLTARGGQSAAYFEAQALKLGYVVTVQNYSPARFGKAKFGDPMYSTRWAHAWSVTGPLGEVTTAKFGTARFGDRFRDWRNPMLECQLREFAPAHAELFFLYDVAPAAKLDDDFILDESLMT